MHVDTKVALYKAIMLSSLLYGCKACTPYRPHIRKLNKFHLHCLRKILHICWQNWCKISTEADIQI